MLDSVIFTFFVLAAYPDTFHATIRVVPGSFGGMTMESGSVLLVGCELSSVVDFSFRGFFEGRAFCDVEPSSPFDSSLLLSSLRFEEVAFSLGGIVLRNLDAGKVWNKFTRRATRLKVCSWVVNKQRSVSFACIKH